MLSTAYRSAMVRAIFRMRENARADKPRVSMADSKSAWEVSSTLQCILRCRLLIWALQKMLVPAKHLD